MKKIDKIVYFMLSIVGELFEMIRFLAQYALGLIWIMYSAVRGMDYKKRLSTLNKKAKNELKWILDGIVFYIKKD